jgi:hypothetical protein
MKAEHEKKARRVKELFIEDLARIEGGTGASPGRPDKPPHCPDITTFICGGSEEAVECVGC